MLSKLVEKTKFLMTQYWPEVGKIAHLLERDNIVNGRDVSSLIGLNVINRATPFLLAEMLGWPCFTQVERFTLDALFITLEQRTEHGLRCCRVRLPAVIAVRQCGEVALPVPGMRQRMAAGKAEIIRKTVAAEMPAMQCLQLARAEQRRGATLIDGQTVAEKAQKLWQDYLRQRMQP